MCYAATPAIAGRRPRIAIVDQRDGRQPQEEVEGDVAVRAVDQVRNHAVRRATPPFGCASDAANFHGGAPRRRIQSSEPLPRPEAPSRPCPSRPRSLVLPGRFRAAVFDMDGLLLDTEPLWHDAERELLERHGDTFCDADLEASHGRALVDTAAVYA